MFNPDQIVRLRGLLQKNPDVRKFEDCYLGRAKLPIDESAERQPEDIIVGTMYPPDRIFGQPIDPSCLSGIGNYKMPSFAHSIGIYENAGVIGSASVLVGGNELYFPRNVREEGIKRLLAQSNSNYLGYLATHSGSQVELVYLSRANPIHRSNTAVFLHNIEGMNYGSFVFRQLPQLLMIKEAQIDFDSFIVPDRTPWLMEALHAAGFLATPVYSVREVSGDSFRRIYMCNAVDTEAFLRSETVARLRDFGSAISSVVAEVSPRKLYVSRSLSSTWRPTYRVMLNENLAEVEAIKNGYTVVQPETLSLAKQAALFRNATHVIGPSGSNMFNTVFCLNHAKVVDIETFHSTVRQHAKLYSSSGHAYSFLFCAPEVDGHVALARKNYRIDLALLTESIDWLG